MSGSISARRPRYHTLQMIKKTQHSLCTESRDSASYRSLKTANGCAFRVARSIMNCQTLPPFVKVLLAVVWPQGRAMQSIPRRMKSFASCSTNAFEMISTFFHRKSSATGPSQFV